MVNALSASNVPDPSTVPPGSDAAIAPPWQIRAARGSDIEALAEILASSFHSREGIGKLFYPILKATIREDLRGRLQNGGIYYRCLVAVSTTASPALGTSPEEVLGTLEIGLKPQFSLPWYYWFRLYPYISNVAIAHSHRRQGIALALLKACEPIARQWGYQDLYLHVLENNQAARGLYEKAGFQISQTEINLPSLLLGQPRQLLLHKGIPIQRPMEANRTGSLST